MQTFTFCQKVCISWVQTRCHIIVMAVFSVYLLGVSQLHAYHFPPLFEESFFFAFAETHCKILTFLLIAGILVYYKGFSYND